jgi:hypothetical protein
MSGGMSSVGGEKHEQWDGVCDTLVVILRVTSHDVVVTNWRAFTVRKRIVSVLV